MKKFQDEQKMISFSYPVTKMYKIFLPFLICATFFLPGCAKKQKETFDVLVSIPPYLYFIDQLTDGELKATSLVPEGANPHLYEPTPKQVQEAKSAKVWVRLSDNFEQRISKSLKEQNKDLIELNLMEEVELPHLPDDHTHCNCGHSHGDEVRDVHIWMSLKLAKIQANLIAKALEQAFPEKAKQIQKNLLLLQDRLTEADSSCTEILLPYQNEAILVSHPAFGYLCNDYELKQISIEYEGKDPLPKKLTEILQLTESTKVRTVLTQAQYNNKGAEIIAERLQLPIHEVDPYKADYLNNFTHIVQLIANP